MTPTIYTAGELLVEIMRPSAGQPLNRSGEFRGPFPSGAPGIFISTAARLGCQTAIIGGVGEDKFGQNILSRLKGDGVDCRLVKQSPRATAVAFVAYEENGEREFIYHIAGTAADDLHLELPPEKPDAFHVMGCSLMASKELQKAIWQIVEQYQDCEISFDPNLRPELLQGRSLSQVAGKIMDHCSILLPGEAELLLAADTPSASIGHIGSQIKEAIEKLFSRHPKLRLIHLKRGERGSCIYGREGQAIEIPRYPIDKVMPVVDATGAGDCFDAAFVWSVLSGHSLEEAGFWASKAGALNVTALGPMEGDMSLLRKRLLPEDDKWLKA